MKNIFNEYGVLMDEDVYRQVNEIAKSFSKCIEKLLSEDVSVIECKALTDYVYGSLCLGANTTILMCNMKKRKKAL